jgi:GNAT superfamily N-acetyltransferase
MKLHWLTDAQMDDTIALLSYLNPNVPAATLRERYEKIMRDHTNYRVLGAFIKGRLVGLTGIWHGTKLWCGDYMEVDNLVVHPDYRGKGIASSLMERVNALAKEAGCNIEVLDSYTTNYPSHRLYQSKGFEIWGFHFIKPLRDFEH